MKNESKLTKSQTKTFTKRVDAKGPYDYDKITATVRYDDQCGNGHNSFAITANTTCRGREDMGGCIHEEIEKHFPELTHLIKWHFMNSDGPMHYIANTTYHADEHGPKMAWIKGPIVENGVEGNFHEYTEINKAELLKAQVPALEINIDEKTAKVADIEAARSCAVWADATPEQLRDVDALNKRLPALMATFRADIEAFGFTY